MLSKRTVSSFCDWTGRGAVGEGIKNLHCLFRAFLEFCSVSTLLWWIQIFSRRDENGKGKGCDGVWGGGSRGWEVKVFPVFLLNENGVMGGFFYLPVSFISGLKEYGPVYRALPEASLQVHVVILLAYERCLKD